MIYCIYYLSFGNIVHHADGSQWGQVVTPGMVIHLKQSFTILNDIFMTELNYFFQDYAIQNEYISETHTYLCI